jgi:glutathione S-transferase
VTDTIAIAETLAERHPDKHMWPQDPAARGFARSITAEMHTGFQNIRNDCTMNLRHFYKGFTSSDAVQVELTRVEEIWTKARTQWGATGPWLFGEYSIADAFYAPLATRIATYNLPVGALAKTYVTTTLNDPAFKEWRAAGLAENYVQPGYDLDLEVAPWAEDL